MEEADETCRKAAPAKGAGESLDPVSYCGHHCDYCFLRDGCGGCRSVDNRCSFATLFEDGECPNVKCAKGKRLHGCFECGQIAGCEKGYYGRANEFVAKATALFISRYGETRYTETLKKAIEDGVNYPRAFDEKGSVENALELLERYK